MIFSSQVPSQFDGFLLVQYLACRFSYLQEADWRRQLVSGRISRNGSLCSDDLPVSVGDSIAFAPDLREFPEPSADLDFQIVHDDEWILGINKPGNLLVHRQGRSLTHNLLCQIRRRDRQSYPEAAVVHRLDRETSGIIILARQRQFVAKLNALFVRHEVKKTYLAVVQGSPVPQSGVIEAPIGRDPDSSVAYRYTAAPRAYQAKQALTRYQVVRTVNERTLVRLTPETGRTHQLRVHLAHIGHPIVGDKLYGRSDSEFVRWRDRPGQEEPAVSSRQALHAESLHFIHPWTGEAITLRAELPADMACWLG